MQKQLEAVKTLFYTSWNTSPQWLQLSSPSHSQEKWALKSNYFHLGSVPKKI